MDLSDKEILNFAIDNGIIDMDTIRKQIEMNERIKYLDAHKFDIWQGSNGKWYTYLPDAKKSNGRRLVKRNSLQLINDTIIDYYKALENEPTIKDVFDGWLKYKIDRNEIQKQTVDRYTTDFKRFFGDISQRKIRHINCELLEKIVISCIKKNKLSTKGWENFRLILKGIFKYARKRGYTQIDINSFLIDLDLSKRTFTRVAKCDVDNIFMPDELNSIIESCNNKNKLNELGILIAAYTGMRVGEIVALKWEDVFEDYIFVHRTQIRYKDDNGKDVYEIRDTPKTEAGIRRIVIVPEVRRVLQELKKINPFTEYVFEHNNKPITKHCLCLALYRICDKLEIPKRGMHVLRKTYASNLIDSGVPESVIISQMGHTDIKTTKDYYYYNNKTISEMVNIISNAINY